MADNDDDPYFLDFLFNDIVDVHWGTGVWLYLACRGSNPALPGTEFDFPELAGGTPGFVLPQAFHESPGGIFTNVLQAPRFDILVTRDMVDLKTKTNAGKNVTGQVAWWLNGFEFGGTGMLIGLSTFPPRFTVRNIDPNSNGTIGITTKDIVKAGKRIVPNVSPVIKASLDVVNGQSVTVDVVKQTIA